MLENVFFVIKLCEQNFDKHEIILNFFTRLSI